MRSRRGSESRRDEMLLLVHDNAWEHCRLETSRRRPHWVDGVPDTGEVVAGGITEL